MLINEEKKYLFQLIRDATFVKGKWRTSQRITLDFRSSLSIFYFLFNEPDILLHPIIQEFQQKWNSIRR